MISIEKLNCKQSNFSMDIRKRWYRDTGVLNTGILDFLLDSTIV